MQHMTFIFPVAESVIREFWEERGEFLAPLVEVTVPMVDIPPEIRRRWPRFEVKLGGGSVHDGSLVFHHPIHLGGAVSAPTSGAESEWDHSVLFGRLVDAVRESDRLIAKASEEKITEWLEEEEPKNLARDTDRGWWTSWPEGYFESAQRSDVEREHERRKGVYQSWVDDQAREARERAERAKQEQGEKEAWAVGSRQAWKVWGRDRGSEDLQAAIEEEYPLGDCIDREVLDLFPDLEGVEILTGGYEVGSDRPVPNGAARELATKLIVLVNNELRDRVPSSATVDVSRIKRVTVAIECPCCGANGGECYGCEDCPPDQKRTGVVVRLTAPHLEMGLEKLYLVPEPSLDI